jgi:hypothetical protein
MADLIAIGSAVEVQTPQEETPVQTDDEPVLGWTRRQLVPSAGQTRRRTGYADGQTG